MTQDQKPPTKKPNRGVNNGKMGRPATKFEVLKSRDKELRMLMQRKCPLEWVAAFFECDADTLAKYIRKQYNSTFTEFRDKMMLPVRLSLMEKAVDMAKSGDRTMLIFTLKNYCGWSDNVKVAESQQEDHDLEFV